MTGFGKASINKKNTKGGPQLLEAAVREHKLGNIRKAESLYLSTIESGFHHEIAFSNLGVIYKNTGREEKAVLIYKKAISTNPNFADAYLNLGNLLKDLGRLDEALDYTLKSLELNPKNSTALINLGCTYQEIGNLDAALVSTLKALELRPNNPEALINLGGIYKNLGKLDEAIATTLKSLELKPNNPEALINLGSVYKDAGNLDKALASTLKSLELKPCNPTALFNLGEIYKDLGNVNKAIAYFKEAREYEEIQDKAAVKLAQIYYYTGDYINGIKMLIDIPTKEAGNTLLSLYLCLNDKDKFNHCANELRSKSLLSQQGIAAIDHANVLFQQTLDNGLGGSTMDAIYVQNIDNHELPDVSFQEILSKLLDGSLQPRVQGHLVNGLQTSGNILDSPERSFQHLKKLIIEKIDEYNKLCKINTDNNFIHNWQNNEYNLRGWAIVMDKGGCLKSHNHENGWLTGTFYLQMPGDEYNTEEGAIEFSHQGPNYPEGNATFETKLIRPSARDLNIFPSSLFHRTLPFQSEKKRICIAFDVTKRTHSK